MKSNLLRAIYCTVSILCLASLLGAQELPDIKVENAKGEIVSIRTIVKDKPVIIAYWSIACKPCIQELNAINDSIEEWKEEFDFEVIAVSVDDVRMKTRAKAMAAASEWDFFCVYDENQELKRAMNVSLTPQSFIIDTNCKVVHSHSGYSPGSEQDLFEKMLELCK